MFCRNLKIPSGKQAACYYLQSWPGIFIVNKNISTSHYFNLTKCTNCPLITQKPKLCSNYSVLWSIHFGLWRRRNISNTICFSCPSKWGVTPDNGTFKVHYPIKQHQFWLSQLFQIVLWIALTACAKIKNFWQL